MIWFLIICSVIICSMGLTRDTETANLETSHAQLPQHSDYSYLVMTTKNERRFIFVFMFLEFHLKANARWLWGLKDHTEGRLVQLLAINIGAWFSLYIEKNLRLTSTPIGMELVQITQNLRILKVVEYISLMEPLITIYIWYAGEMRSLRIC